VNRRVPAHVADACANVRLTVPEMAQVRRAAHLAGYTIGGYVRATALLHARTLDARRLPRWLPEEHVYTRPPIRVRDRRNERVRRAQAHHKATMLDLLSRPVTSATEARAYLLALDAAGYSYHCDDPAADIVRSATGLPLFTPEEAVLADARMDEVCAHLDDPCSVLLDVWAGE